MPQQEHIIQRDSILGLKEGNTHSLIKNSSESLQTQN